jgi:hypothetical protein
MIFLADAHFKRLGAVGLAALLGFVWRQGLSRGVTQWRSFPSRAQTEGGHIVSDVERALHRPGRRYRAMTVGRLERLHHTPIGKRREGGILADIATALTLGDYEKTAWHLQQQAAAQFAELNGWQLSGIHFGIDAIGKGGRGNVQTQRPLFDHPLFFKSGRMNAAIVSQPYCDFREPCRDDGLTWDLFAFKYRLAVSFPPNLRASFHSPGHAFFVVLHERSHVAQWLPEQVVS